MSAFASGAMAHLFTLPANTPQAFGAFDPATLPKFWDVVKLHHPPITSPEVKHLAAKLLADPDASADARRLAGSVMAHIERHETGLDL